MRVVQAGDRPSLALETLSSLGVVRKMGGKNLDSDSTIESGVFGLVNLAHSAGANERNDLVGAQARTGF